MTNQQRIQELQKTLDIDNIQLAEAFIAINLKQLKLRKNTKLYVAAVDFIASKIKRGQSPLSKRDLNQLQKDEASKTLGSIHKKLKKEFENIVKLYAITIDADPPPTRERIGERPPLPNPNPTRQPTVSRKPEVELTSNTDRVEKGGSVTLTWKSKHAVRVKRTNIPGVKTNQVNGTTVVDDVRRRRDFYIVVEGPDKQSAEDKVVTLIETQRFLQGKDDSVPVNNQRQRQVPTRNRPRTSTSTEQEQEQEEVPVIQTRSNSLSNDILSSIDKSLTGILNILKSQFKINETFLAGQRKLTEEERRNLKEKEMETPEKLSGGLKDMKEGAEKMISPFKKIIDKIVNFIVYTFLGRAFSEVVKWFNDPENKDKVQAMGRFLKDFWPLIAGVAVWFLTPFGSFVVGTVKFLVGTVKTLKALGSIIKKLIFRGGKTPTPGGSRPSPRVTQGRGGTTIPRGSARITGDVVRPGGFSFGLKGIAGGIAKGGIGLLGEYAIGKGFDVVQDKIINGHVSKINSLPPNQRKKAIENINKRLKKETDYINSPAHNIDKIISLGGETQPEKKVRFLSSILNRLGEVAEYASGGKIFSGLVGPNDGMKVSGAGKDTQMFPIAGGGAAILQPGELVLQPKAVNKLLKLGIDPLALNEGPSANKPKTIGSNNIALMNTGGVVGGPNISAADYNTLLAIAALESDRPQGRADVAQSIYNRMLAASKYGVNFLQKSNSLKDLILARDQYQPTFLNQKDWQNISKDVTSAAIAVMNSDKGKRYKWDMNEAMAQIRAAEKALKDPLLQKNAAKFVKGIPSFRGTSEQKSMRPDLGDVLRDKKDNFFTTLDLEKTPYPKSQWKIPAPIPRMLIAKPQEPSKPQKQPNLLEQAGQFLGGVGDKIRGMFAPKKKMGGLVGSSSGEVLQGRASDPILTRLEVGEYVIPKVAVAKIGTDILDMVSALDPNSTGSMRVSKMELNIPTPRPLTTSRPQMNMETLPPIMQGSNATLPAGNGTPIPSFSATTAEHIRSANASIYGII